VSYLYAFLGFAALIVLHEAGHFVAAKAVGMRVERFSLFFGPMLLKRQVGETVYGVGVIPLGGYVKITGMNPEEEMPPEVVPRAYFSQAVWKRIVVIAAGPAVNIVLAFVILWFVLLHDGRTITTNTVAAVVHPSPAARVLKPGDRILSVDGVTGGEPALRAAISRHRCPGRQVNGCRARTPVTMVVKRGGRVLTLHVRPRYSAAARRPLVGFDFGARAAPLPAGPAASRSVTDLWRVTGATVSAIARIVEPQERKQLSGVVGVYTVTQQSFARNPTFAWQVLALISLSLGVINLFPFLPLDGGHIFWAVAEKLRGRRIPFAVMERAGFVGVALIVCLFAIGLTNDISRLSGPGFNVP
jgi:regulator of sigma E protease